MSTYEQGDSALGTMNPIEGSNSRETHPPLSAEGLFAGGGELGALMREIDWAKTPLGSVEK